MDRAGHAASASGSAFRTGHGLDRNRVDRQPCTREGTEMRRLEPGAAEIVGLRGRKVGRVVAGVLVVVVLVLAVLVGALWLWSTGRPAPVVDELGRTVPGSISEKVFVEVNGVRQGMIVRGRDRSNPVLLFVHGGPGMPEYFLSERYPTGLENAFTVVWWDQRGAGLSFRPGLAAQTTVEQLTADTIAVTNELRSRFGVDKIYLMAHSGGSSFAIQAVAQAPELYEAYIGMGQMTYQLASERLAYRFMLDAYRDRGDARMVRRLEAAAPGPSGPLPDAYLALRDQAMHGLGIGTTRDMRSVATGIFLPSLWTRQYTLAEKVNLWRGKIASAKALRGPMFALDVPARVTELKIPAYFFEGAYDYTCSYQLARDYFEALRAPVKGFYTFAASAHSPIFEEPVRAVTILRQDVMAGTATLADPDEGSALPDATPTPNVGPAGTETGAGGVHGAS